LPLHFVLLLLLLTLQYALDHLPKAAAQELYTRFVAFEKQHGSR
jgi:hypothetical protein